jgi:hypothetical protein
VLKMNARSLHPVRNQAPAVVHAPNKDLHEEGVGRRHRRLRRSKPPRGKLGGKLMAPCGHRRFTHHAAKQYLGLIAPAGRGARRACVNWAAPSSWQWAPLRPGGAPGGRYRWSNQPLQGLECLRDPPGTGFSIIWRLLRTVGVVLLCLGVAGRAWRCSSAILTELLSFKAPECCTFSYSSKCCNYNRCKARFLQVP